MFVDFFIKRSIFASVCAIVILLIGLISIPSLLIARFPEITLTQISVTSNYNAIRLG
ncbi:MAG: efflux RND transporter permease subunit [Nostoc sp.]